MKKELYRSQNLFQIDLIDQVKYGSINGINY